MRIGCKIFAVLFLILLFVGGGFIYFRYFYVLADGVKEGQLNYLTHKGYVFKTYEGRIIQTGFKSNTNNTGMQSNEFEFSVDNDSLAKVMETLSGHNMQLHYKEYNATLPWRGYSRYIVDKILTVDGQTINNNVFGIKNIESNRDQVSGQRNNYNQNNYDQTGNGGYNNNGYNSNNGGQNSQVNGYNNNGYNNGSQGNGYNNGQSNDGYNQNVNGYNQQSNGGYNQ